MRKEINCFILAAGLGERLRPITGQIPKPLLPVLGEPLLGRLLEKLSGLPARRIGMNLHYKKEEIRDWTETSPYKDKVQLFIEDPVLDTGGALKNAESFLSTRSIFLVHNSDILSDIDLTKLISHHRASGNVATLAVHDFSRFNTVAVDGNGIVTGVAGKGYICDLSEERLVAYTGIAVYNREFLDFLPEGKSGVVDAWIAAAASGKKIGTLDVTGQYWTDVGTPADYASAVSDALKAEGEVLYFHADAEGCSDAAFYGYNAVEKGCKIGRGVLLKNCIVLPGSSPHRGDYEDCIIGKDFVLPYERTAPVNNDQLIGIGGSDRKYFRVARNGSTAVEMRCAEADQDFARHMDYTFFFRKYMLPVPALISVDAEKKIALFEDLGDISLYSWLKCPRESRDVQRMYMKALDMLVVLHGTVTDHVSECELLASRVFDYDHLRWESSYFVERYAEGVRGTGIPDPKALENEFHRLALRVDSFPKTVIHRDFQSQNIMVTGQDTPRLIDYQGARMAAPAYDVVSLLWDPYYRLDNDMQERLLEYYTVRMRDESGGRFDAGKFRETILPCRLQRHMQALGAYGFLSSVKGKKFFLKYAPEALRMLKEETSLTRDDYPVLYTLVSEL